jgi:hypothetical protein
VGLQPGAREADRLGADERRLHRRVHAHAAHRLRRRGGYWFSFYDTIYVRYVSDDTAFGLDYAKWPATFIEYVKAYFAGKIVHKLPNSKGRIEYLNGPTGRPQKGYVHQCLVTAKNKCAMAQPTTFPTRGTWSAARSRGYSRNPWRDGGNQNSLIG